MRTNRTDIVDPRYICAIGVRESLAIDDGEAPLPKRWESYARMSTGSDFLFAVNCTKGEAIRTTETALHVIQMAGEVFVPAMTGYYINRRNIVKLFVDAQGSQFVALAEDVSGATWALMMGKKRECVDHIRQQDKGVSLPTSTETGE